ncbi:fructose PTS transporter subunit IIA [Collinsella sp. zg1085]|uniref:PTS sugar transporter subunit IIA n=1 Tax=Collinsella sp. zg1085 TaxID=2844380 RepID=UPI001C0D8648|nr:fructose PTS transporter subunit IIA [Collinsella sp. zg1085]QWT17408.1 fructose PTS transporter subunit IIA [Collinsella sp. zg1085]
MALLSAEQVEIGFAATTREDALLRLAEHGVARGFASDKEALYQAFLAREAEAETGLMDGFAVPHAKSEAIVEPGVFVLKLAEPVEWPSFDKQPVDIALALYVPASEAGTTHLRLLSRAATLLMRAEFRAELRACDNPVQLAEIINARLEGER